MRKFILIALTLALLITMQVTAFATEMELSLSDKTTDQGQMVYVTVALTEPVIGNSVAVTFTYDEAVLSSQPEKSAWSQQGIIQDFGMVKDAGVWTVAQSRNLQGEICVLAFRVLPEAAFANTKISCKVIVKGSSELVAEYTGQVMLQSSCEHDFGPWEDNGEIGHTQRCKLCGGSSTQSHIWDKGTVTENEDSSSVGIRKFTCTVCGATKSSQIDIARPEDENDDKPQNNTTDTNQRPTVDDHDHPQSQPTTDSHGHTHDEPQSGEKQELNNEQEPESIVLGVVVIGISLAIMGGAILYFVLKSKKRKNSNG